jgi:hypothetical protein
LGEFFRWKRDVELAAGKVGVSLPVEEQAAGQPSVAPGPASLLVIRLGCRGQGPVHHQSDIGLVDAHAEGAGRHDDPDVVSQEPLQDLFPREVGEPRVIGRNSESGIPKHPGEFFDEIAGWGIHNGQGVLQAERGDEGPEPVPLVPHRCDPEPEIAAVEGPENFLEGALSAEAK